MKEVCFWCRRTILAEPTRHNAVKYGICPKCASKAEKDTRRTLKRVRKFLL